MAQEQDEDKSLKEAIREGEYLVVDLTVTAIREYFNNRDSIALDELDNLLDECQGNIYSGNSTEQFIVLRIRQ